MLGGPGGRQPEAPLTGTLAGYVKLHTFGGELGAGDVWLVADTGQSVKTDANGYFQIPEVVQGPRVVKIDLDRLPADFDPPEKKELTVDVRSGQLSRIDLAVTPLEGIDGDITDSSGAPAAEGIAVELLPKGEYTSTDSDGRFGFYNLQEGDYEIRVMEPTLPENAKLVSPLSAKAEVRYGKTAAPVEFAYAIVLPGPKPSKKVLTDRPARAVPAARPSSQFKSRPQSQQNSQPKQSATPGQRRVIIRTTADNVMPSLPAAVGARSAASQSVSLSPAALAAPAPEHVVARWVAR
jgi:hypothetical protein